jgi:mono/diheme cytochrome c family protein
MTEPLRLTRGVRAAAKWVPAGAAVCVAALVSLTGCDALMQPSTPGEKLWRQRCAECHGRDGAGNTPRYMGNYKADLLDDSWQHGGDPGSWEVVIREGVFGQMPANEDLDREQVEALVEHLRQLRQRATGTRE